MVLGVKILLHAFTDVRLVGEYDEEDGPRAFVTEAIKFNTGEWQYYEERIPVEEMSGVFQIPRGEGNNI